MSHLTDPFRSERLCFRAIDSKNDLPFYVALNSDPEAQMGASFNLPMPESSETQEEFLKIIKSSFLVVVICLPPAAEGDSPIPIGSMGLQRDTHVKRIQHRNCSIGIRILRDFRSKGYGTEAVEWALGWAFRRAGLHKVKIGCVGWNTRAGKVYERMGFVQEAVLREELWHDGKWWDQIDMSMLEQEYWAREEERKQKTGVQDGSRVE